MIAASSRLHRPLAALLAAVLVLSGTPAARATAGTVEANNGSGNGIARGLVVRADPDNARVTVTNGFHFWAVLDVSYVGGSNLLHPTDPRVDFGGIYAGGGLIGPGATAAWDGQFGAGSQALVRVHYDLSSAGGAAALAANLLTIIADSLGVSLSASSSSRLLTALKVVTDLSTWADFVRQAQTNDIWGIVTSVELMLGSKAGRDTIRYALAELGVVASDAGLVKVASVVGIIDWAWTLFDIYRAVLTGQNDGTVIFSVAPPAVTPGAAATPTPEPTATTAAGGAAGLDWAGTQWSGDWSSAVDGWTFGPGWTVVGGMLVSDGSWGNVLAPYEPPGTTFAVEADVQLIRVLNEGSLTGRADSGVLVRASPDGGGFVAGYCTSALVLRPCSDTGHDYGIYTASGEPLDTSIATPGDGWHTYLLVIRDNNLTLMIDGAVVAEATDNRYLDGTLVGFHTAGIEVNIRSFRVLSP